MDACEGGCSPTECDLMRKAVLDMVRRGPVALAAIVMRLEAVAADQDAPPCGISRCLHEMARAGLVSLRIDGRGWRVSLAPAGRALCQHLSASGGWAAGAVVQATGAGGPAYPR